MEKTQHLWDKAETRNFGEVIPPSMKIEKKKGSLTHTDIHRIEKKVIKQKIKRINYLYN